MDIAPYYYWPLTAARVCSIGPDEIPLRTPELDNVDVVSHAQWKTQAAVYQLNGS